MKLLIIGGTGKTGRELIKQGLEQGHFITAIVRNPKKIKNNHPKLKVLKADVLIPESLKNAFQGQPRHYFSVPLDQLQIRKYPYDFDSLILRT